MSEPTWASAAEPLPEIDTTKPHPARIYDYWLGGKDNYPADQAVAERVAEEWPFILSGARRNREFLARSVRYLAGEVGIRQFLDIGTGIPTQPGSPYPNTHAVAQSASGDSRVVYVDNDPIVLATAHALLTTSPLGATAYIEADLCDPDSILAHPELTETLDLDQPVAVMLLMILQFVTDADQAYDVVKKLMRPMCPGSVLVITHPGSDLIAQETFTRIADAYRPSAPLYWRNRREFATFFDGLELLDPGIQLITDWRPDSGAPRLEPAEVGAYGAAARKP